MNIYICKHGREIYRINVRGVLTHVPIPSDHGKRWYFNEPSNRQKMKLSEVRINKYTLGTKSSSYKRMEKMDSKQDDTMHLLSGEVILSRCAKIIM